jgi:hypothetical protein
MDITDTGILLVGGHDGVFLLDDLPIGLPGHGIEGNLF